MHELRAAGFDLTCERVETAQAMKEALERGGWDIVLSDYSLPTFSGPDALHLKQTMGSDIPFIIVSGTIGEETAVSALKAGAHDFLVKGRLARLVPAIDRELRDAAERRERKQLEEQLNHAQKMEAIGQLAGSVAHDFNNVLTAILGFCELALGGMAPEAPERDDLMEIRNAGERAAGLTRQLLAFSRQQVLQPKVHDLNSLVNGVLPMLRRLLIENIDVVLSLEANAPKIRIDATQLEQILINLVVNARDAMPRGGRLTIGTRGDAVGTTALVVADTGEGMDEATRARIFEPFFTTKGAGKGTGLGLATVQRIVKQCDGSIDVTSEPRNGTTFRVNFPGVAHPAASHQELHAATGASGGSETVLLAEDDPSVRLLARLSLRRCGYTVLEAGSATEAVAIANDYAKPIDLLLSDVIMPDSTGNALLIDRLRIRRPDLRVLYMSGYTDDAIVHHGVLDEGTAFLQKPFTPQALTQKVREVLEGVTQ